MKYNENRKVIFNVEDGWECTDVDNLQFARKINNKSWEYCQILSEEKLEVFKKTYPIKDMPYCLNGLTTIEDWCCGDIDVEDYDSDEVGSIISSYGGILDGVTDESEKNQLICECIFESYMFTDFNPNLQ